MPTPGQGTIGSLDFPPEERRRLARLSSGYVCPECGPIAGILKDSEDEEVKGTAEREAREIAKEVSVKVRRTVFCFPI